jgi:hypothetical protein
MCIYGCRRGLYRMKMGHDDSHEKYAQGWDGPLSVAIPGEG